MLSCDLKQTVNEADMSELWWIKIVSERERRRMKNWERLRVSERAFDRRLNSIRDLGCCLRAFEQLEWNGKEREKDIDKKKQIEWQIKIKMNEIVIQWTLKTEESKEIKLKIYVKYMKYNLDRCRYADDSRVGGESLSKRRQSRGKRVSQIERERKQQQRAVNRDRKR